MIPDRRQRFNAVAEDYDNSRPGYPEDLVRRLDPPGNTIEIGCGSGQLTVTLVARGHRVVAVDLGADLLARAHSRCPQAEFLLGRFEEVDLKGRTFDLAVAATAFHWVDPDVGYAKVASVLRPGGRLALLSHRVVAGPFGDELDELIARCAPIFPLAHGRTAATEVAKVSGSDTSNISAVLAAIEGTTTRAVEAGARFGPVEVSWVEWDQLLTAPALLASLRSTTAWPSVPERQRIRLHDAIGELVERHGGRFPRRRITFLAVATLRRSCE